MRKCAVLVLLFVMAAAGGGPCEPATCAWLKKVWKVMKGTNWTKVGDWGGNKDPCEWDGVVCNSTTHALQGIHLGT